MIDPPVFISLLVVIGTTTHTLAMRTAFGGLQLRDTTAAILTRIIHRNFQRTSSSSNSSEKSNPPAEGPINLPEVYIQDHLIHLYFTYVHIFFPVVHKKQFLVIYDS